MNETPQVSVCLAAYNGACHIAEVLECLKRQTYDHIEVLVFDNASDDGTSEIVSQFVRADQRFSHHRTVVNQGELRNYIRMFNGGTAPYIMPKSADDVITDDYIEKIMKVMIADEKNVLVYSIADIIDEKGCYLATDCSIFRTSGRDPLADALTILEKFRSSPPFWGIYRRSILERCRLFRYYHGLDHFLMLEIALYGKIDYVNERLFFRRLNRDYWEKVKEGETDVFAINKALRSSEFSQRGLATHNGFSSLDHRVPFMCIFYGYLDVIALAYLDEKTKRDLVDLIIDYYHQSEIFQARAREDNQVFSQDIMKNIKNILSNPELCRAAEVPYFFTSLLKTVLNALVLSPGDAGLLQARARLIEALDTIAPHHQQGNRRPMLEVKAGDAPPRGPSRGTTQG